jgi:hypothetical protein
MERGGFDEGNPARKTVPSDYRHSRYSSLESEATVLFIGINICATHLCSQLNDPIPVDDNNETLPQRLSKPITDFSVKLGKRTQKLSDIFPSLPEDHISKIVFLVVASHTVLIRPTLQVTRHRQL